MVILSSIPKLDMFQIAEDMDSRGMLTHMYTGFASQKNRLINAVVKRRDNEQIPSKAITDFWSLQVVHHFHRSSIYNEAFDRIVAQLLKKRDDYKAVLAWSGMAEHTLIQAKKEGKLAVVARGSCHIEMQNMILTQEFSKYGLRYEVDDRITKKELREYKIAEKIYVCSSFVKNSFLERGFEESKIFVNPIPVSALFSRIPSTKLNDKFIILFLGKLTIQKGLRYLFEAIEQLDMAENDFEVWFVGGFEKTVLAEFYSKKKSNWKYIGFVPQRNLAQLISCADVGVFPSVQDGFAQVVTQQLSCGVPVIATSNTGASDLIVDGYNGYVVAPFSSSQIAEKIMLMYHNCKQLAEMKINAEKIKSELLSNRVIADNFANFFKSNL